MLLRAILAMAVLLAASPLAKGTTDGPAAQQFGAWLETFNEGDRARLLAYHQRAFSYDVASRDVGDIDRELDLRQATGGFELLAAEEVTATSFTALLQERRSDQHARAVMKVAASAPYPVTAFAIHPIAPPVGRKPAHLGEAELVDGPAARQFTAWLAAFDKEDQAALRAYHDRFFPYRAWPGMSLAGEHALSIESAGFEVKEIETATATTYSALIMDRATHFFAEARMQVEPTAPHRVVSFDLRLVDKPAKYRAPERPLDAARRRQLIDALTRAVDADYVFPDVGTRIVAAVREHARRGDYDEITDCARFAERLTEELQAISHDKHLRLSYTEASPPHPRKPDPRALGFGFGAVERLPGNVARVVIYGFGPFDKVRAAVADFMGRIADADALILDLRDNGGGDPRTEALVASFLFDDQPVHLLDFVARDGTSTASWTTPDAGKRFGGRKPLYVLTSRETISGGEALAYALQTRKRATLIGETTAGAANPAGGHRLDDWFVLFVPSSRGVDPISKTNWEGVGVRPDVATKADAACDEALGRVARDLHR